MAKGLHHNLQTVGSEACEIISWGWSAFGGEVAAAIAVIRALGGDCHSKLCSQKMGREKVWIGSRTSQKSRKGLLGQGAELGS